jgi:hypothetical protein
LTALKTKNPFLEGKGDGLEKNPKKRMKNRMRMM